MMKFLWAELQATTTTEWIMLWRELTLNSVADTIATKQGFIMANGKNSAHLSVSVMDFEFRSDMISTQLSPRL